jgi:hypothetical protein
MFGMPGDIASRRYSDARGIGEPIQRISASCSNSLPTTPSQRAGAPYTPPGCNVRSPYYRRGPAVDQSTALPRSSLAPARWGRHMRLVGRGATESSNSMNCRFISITHTVSSVEPRSIRNGFFWMFEAGKHQILMTRDTPRSRPKNGPTRFHARRSFRFVSEGHGLHPVTLGPPRFCRVPVRRSE